MRMGWLLPLAAASQLISSPVAVGAGEGESWSVEAELDYASRFVFRGLDLLGEGRPVWYPRLTVTRDAWSVWYEGTFGEFDRVDEHGRSSDGSYGETDLGLDWTVELGSLELTLGVATYQYTDEVEAGLDYADTFEVYAEAAWEVALAPTLSYYHDVDAVDGGFLTVDIAQGVPLGARARIDFVAQLGFDFGYNQPGDPQAGADRSQGELHHAMLGLDLPWQITESLAAHALVQRFFSLEIADELGQPDVTVVTIGATFDF